MARRRAVNVAGFALACAAVAIGCGDRSRSDGAGSGTDHVASGSAPAPPPRVPDGARELAMPRRDGPTELVRGARRIGLVNAGRWFAAAGDQALQELPDVARRLAAACGEHDRTLFLARDPLAMCGEDHHERTSRLGASEKAELVELPGVPLRAVALDDGSEVWVVEERLQTQLVVIAPGGAAVVHPPFERTGALPDSPVRAKACATARIADLAGDGREAVALIVECDPAAPVRTARVTAGRKPSVSAAGRFDFVAERIAVAAGLVAIAGHRGGELVLARIGRGAPAILTGPRPAAQVTSLEVTEAGAIWALTVGTRDRRDVWTLSRDGTAVPTGASSPRALGHDAALGIVVAAADGAAFAWRAR